MSGHAHTDTHVDTTPAPEEGNSLRVIGGVILLVVLIIAVLYGKSLRRNAVSNPAPAAPVVVQPAARVQQVVMAHPYREPDECKTPCKIPLDGNFELVHLHPGVELHATVHLPSPDPDVDRTGLVVFRGDGSFKSDEDKAIWSQALGGDTFFDTPGHPGLTVRIKRK